MKDSSPMNARLKQARIKAGYQTASQAIETLGWRGSTYRAHENGQNNFHADEAKQYGKAYGVSASWLLLGENDQTPPTKNRKSIKIHKHNCADHIFAASTLLKDDPSNLDLIEKIEACLNSLKHKK